MALGSSEVAPGADPVDYIATITSLLVRALEIKTTTGKRFAEPHFSRLLPKPPIYAFSNFLLNALLAQDASFSSDEEELLSLIHQHRDIMTIVLDTVSLQCLSSYLLKSCSDEGLDLGLYLLIDEPEYIATSESMPSQINLPGSEILLPLAQRKLLQEVYSIFLSNRRDIRVRRMAGKVLTEMLYDSDEHCRLLWELAGSDKLRSFLNVLTESDVVLSFFSSTIVRALYHSGASSRQDWEPDGPYTKLMQHIETADAIDQFYSYTNAENQHTTNVRSETWSNNSNGALPRCYVVASSAAYAEKLREGPMLLHFGTDILHLISCGKEMLGWKTDYVTIRLTHHTQSRYTVSSGNTESRRLLSLQIHAEDLATVNDKEYDLQAVDLSIATGDDMIMIIKRLESIGIQCQTKNNRTSPSTRRSSSVAIPLDLDDEATPTPSPRPNTSSIVSKVSARAYWREKIVNVDKRLECVPETAGERLSQSSLTELTRTPTFTGTSSPGGKQSPHSTSCKPFAEGQQMRMSPQITGIAAGASEGADIAPISRKAQAIEKLAFQHVPNVPEDAPARNTRSKSSQNASQGEDQNKKPARRGKNVLKPIPSNTQESLIFSKRRRKAKYYTAPSKKATVDWDKDLRASDACVEAVSQKENELTSVSSPSSSGPRLNSKQSLKKRRLNSARKKPVAKTKKRTRTVEHKSNNKPAGQECPKKEARTVSSPLVQSIEEGVRDVKPPTDVSQTKSGIQSKVRTKSNDEQLEQQSAAGHSQVPTLTDNLISSELNIPKPQSYDSSNVLSTIGHSSNGDESFGRNHQGRGQTVAEKLIAALRGSMTPRRRVDDITSRLEEIPESSQLQNEHERTGPQPDISGSTDVRRKVPDSWASNMSQDVTIVDEMYPVELYPIEPAGDSRVRSLQGSEAGTDWTLGKEDRAMLESENRKQSTRAYRAFSSISSSSAEPQSPGSTFEYYFTSPPPKVRYTTSNNSVSAETIVEDGKPDFGQKLSGILSTTRDIEAANSTSKSERVENGSGRIAESSAPSPKITVDNNGSPQMMPQENLRWKMFVGNIPRRRAASVAAEQPPTAKRTRVLDQNEFRETTLQAPEQSHANKIAPQALDSSLATQNTYTSEGSDEHGFNEHLSGDHVQMVKGMNTESSASKTTTTGIEQRLPFLGRLKATVKGRQVKLSSSISTTRKEQTSSQHSHFSKAQQYAAGNAQTKGAILERGPAFDLSGSMAVPDVWQNDWQTSLQELHRGMKRTLLENSEHLSRQIESEKSTIDKVLNVYREQCHTVLNQLFEAQTERIRMCKQQIESIKEQHSAVCQGLIRRLEENEQSVGAAAGSQ